MADEDFRADPPTSDVPDTDAEAPAPSPVTARQYSGNLDAQARKTAPAYQATPAHRLSRTAQSALSPFARAREGRNENERPGATADSSITQESAAIDADDIDRHYFLERRIVVLEEETSQLNARIRLAEKGVEDSRRLAMAACVFALGAMLVAKLLAH